MKAKSPTSDNWLVTGAAGYIGSHVLHEALKQGKNVIALDDLSLGKKSRVPSNIPFYQNSISDLVAIKEIIEKEAITGIIHTAALKQARESEIQPIAYWETNVADLIIFLSGLQNTEVRYFVLSSSCSVFGNNPCAEDNSEYSPVSTYGRTKMVSEIVVEDICKKLAILFTNLRYYNVIGCADFLDSVDVSSELLVPKLTKALQENSSFTVLGRDHETSDGTALRDFIDVRDLATAHLRVMDDLHKKEVPRHLNVTGSRPATVGEVISKFFHVAGNEISVTYEARAIGDPSVITGKVSRYFEDQQWKAQFSLEESLRSHWKNRLISPVSGKDMVDV